MNQIIGNTYKFKFVDLKNKYNQVERTVTVQANNEKDAMRVFRDNFGGEKKVKVLEHGMVTPDWVEMLNDDKKTQQVIGEK